MSLYISVPRNRFVCQYVFKSNFITTHQNKIVTSQNLRVPLNASIFLIDSNLPAITIRKLRAGLLYWVGKMLGEGEWQEEGLQPRFFRYVRPTNERQ